MRKRAFKQELEPYWYNDDISIVNEMYIGETLVTPGSLLRVKHHSEPLKFVRLASNSRTGQEWVDLCGSYGFLSVRVNKIIGLYVAKKSRRKKVE